MGCPLWLAMDGPENITTYHHFTGGICFPLSPKLDVCRIVADCNESLRCLGEIGIRALERYAASVWTRSYVSDFYLGSVPGKYTT